MIWSQLNSLEQWNVVLESEEKFIVFKHSTRCSISTTALSRFERDWDTSSSVKLYYLDLLEHRNISNDSSSGCMISSYESEAIRV